MERKIEYYLTRGFIEPTDIVIDAGCGTGEGTVILSQVAKKVVGLDKDIQVIKEAMKISKRENNYFVLSNVDQMEEFPVGNVTVAINIIDKLRFANSFIAKVSMSTKRLFVFTRPIDLELDVRNDWKEVFKHQFENKFLEVYKKI